MPCAKLIMNCHRVVVYLNSRVHHQLVDPNALVIANVQVTRLAQIIDAEILAQIIAVRMQNVVPLVMYQCVIVLVNIRVIRLVSVISNHVSYLIQSLQIRKTCSFFL